MKRLLYAATLAMLAMLILAPAALAQQVSPEDYPESGTGFPYCPEGEFFATAPGDPGEGTGVCFETAEAAAAYSNTGELPQDSGTQQESQQISCSDFVSAAGSPSQFQAQQFFDFNATPQQQAILDVDGDGFACDSLETGVDNLGITDAERAAAQQQAAAQQPVEQTPVATDGTQMQEMPDTGGPVLLIPGAGLLLALGFLGLAVSRRRTS